MLQPPPPVDFAQLVLKPSPNQFLVAPEGLCRLARPHRAAPVFAVPANRLRRAFAEIAESAPRTRRLRADDSLAQDDYVQRSALLGFPDVVTFRAIPLDGGQAALALYSRSLYGWSDLGVNRARALGWLAQLSARLGG